MIEKLSDTEIFQIQRPHEDLMKYYILTSLFLGPLFFIALIPLYFRYHTLRYHFDEKGISMRWGILFRREINLAYARIQDIHLSSNFVERWLGLARIQIQTASGQAGAEMTIEGIKEFEEIRNFLYAHMRGTSSLEKTPNRAEISEDKPTSSQLVKTLQEIASEIRLIRHQLDGRKSTEADHV